MIPDLETATAKESLVRAIKYLGRGAGNVGAFALAVPLGFFHWSEYEPLNLTDKPSLRQEISYLYHTFKPYTPQQPFH